MCKLLWSYKDTNVKVSLHSVVLIQTKSLVVQIRPQMFLVTSTIYHQMYQVFPHLACPLCFQSTIQPVAQNLSLICELFSYVEVIQNFSTEYVTHLVANGFSISLMKQQFVVTHQYTVLKKTEKTRQILNRPAFRHIIFYEDIKIFFVDTTF